jgi:hypothetical protein
MGQPSKSQRLDHIKHGLLLGFVAVCCLMIALTLVLALSEGLGPRDDQNSPAYLITQAE